MSISRVLGRLLLIPLAGVLAGCAATLVAFFANWKVFVSVIGGDPMTSGDVVAIMVGFAMLLVSSAATFPMLLWPLGFSLGRAPSRLPGLRSQGAWALLLPGEA